MLIWRAFRRSAGKGVGGALPLREFEWDLIITPTLVVIFVLFYYDLNMLSCRSRSRS